MHEIYYWDYEENTNRSEIMAEIQDIAEREGDGYHSSMTWHDKLAPFESREEAKTFIERENTDHWYDDHAVRYMDYSSASKTKKCEELESKIKDLVKLSREYEKKHSVHNSEAKHIGCKNCGSKLNKEYIVGEKCPLCRHDLRSKTTLEKLEYYRKKIDEYGDKIKLEMRKQKKAAKVMWLVKFEFHS